MTCPEHVIAGTRWRFPFLPRFSLLAKGRLDANVVLARAAVGIPLSWGVLKTLENAAKIFL
jgi:hypothetical protein